MIHEKESRQTYRTYKELGSQGGRARKRARGDSRVLADLLVTESFQQSSKYHRENKQVSRISEQEGLGFGRQCYC